MLVHIIKVERRVPSPIISTLRFLFIKKIDSKLTDPEQQDHY